MHKINLRYSVMVLLAILVVAVSAGCGGDSLSSVANLAARPPDPGTVRVSAGDGNLETHNGLPVGFTEEGYPFRGDPDAPVTIIEYSDYLCPFCRLYTADTLPQLLDSHVATGQVNMVFREFPLTGLHPTAPIGHAAALCVAEQGAAVFWEMHDRLFQTQQQWNQLADPTEFVAEVGRAVAPDERAFDECLASGRTMALVDEGVAAGNAAGFNGTPSFLFVNNQSGDSYPFIGAQPYSTFAGTLDAILAGEAPEEIVEPTPEPAELPYWANEGLRPDPNRPGVTLAGDPFKGNPDAPLVVVEFSDFQCPACRDHAANVQPAIDEALVDTGEIMWVFKNLPLRIHPHSVPAAVAAECAAEQGAFWEMHEAIFAAQNEWAVEDADQVLASLAADIVGNAEQFNSCFQSRQPLESVMDDMWDAQGVVNETPSFIMIYDGAGRVFRGSMPPDQFIKTLEGMLEEIKSEE
jgi:protein-disulfide isomerase